MAKGEAAAADIPERHGKPPLSLKKPLLSPDRTRVRFPPPPPLLPAVTGAWRAVPAPLHQSRAWAWVGSRRVAAWSVNRLGRSLQRLLEFQKQLHAIGIDLYLHQQGIDTTTPAGKAMFHVCGVFAEFERSKMK